MLPNNRELLYRFFDDDLSAEETRMLQTQLEESDELRKEKQEIQSMRELLQDNKESTFGPWFLEKVMNHIFDTKNSYSEGFIFFSNLKALFRPFAIAAVIIIAVLIPINLNSIYQSNNLTISETIVSMAEEETLTYMEELL